MTTPTTDQAVTRRLRPLHVAVALQGTMLWVPVEKLFMVDIGFTAASIGVMAAAYAAVVPLLEVPSGVLADRWSRRGVMVLATTALMLCSLLGGLSQGVGTYIVSALFLGVHFAMASGTLDSMVYDTVVEEAGEGSRFERRIGRLRLTEGIAFAVSSLAGGVLADLTSPRAAYLLTVPFAAGAVVALLRFREPRLHQAAEPVRLRAHVALTLRTATARRSVLPLVLTGAAAGVAVQMVFEFGPLWLVALAVPVHAYGPYWAALTATLGLGGLLAGRVPLGRPRGAAAAGLVLVVAGLVQVSGTGLAGVAAGQVVLALVLVVVGIHLSQRLHDAVPSAVRAGVASGVGTATWMGFLPAALLFGWLAEGHGVRTAGWLLVGLLSLVGVTLLRLAAAAGTEPAHVDGPACAEVAELASDHLDGRLPPQQAAAVQAHLAWCPGCAQYVEQLRELVRSLRMLR